MTTFTHIFFAIPCIPDKESSRRGHPVLFEVSVERDRREKKAMLPRLKRASRRGIALVWAMVVVFASAPVIGVAYGAPAGVFSRFLVHAHADGDHGHVHHGDHDHPHHGHHHDAATRDGPEDPGHGPAHAHYDAYCPSLLMSVPTASVLYRVGHRITIPPAEAKQGAPPGRLLRPPILSL